MPSLDRAAYHQKHGGTGSHAGCPHCDRAEQMVKHGRKIAQYGRHPVIRLNWKTAGMLPLDCIENPQDIPEWD